VQVLLAGLAYPPTLRSLLKLIFFVLLVVRGSGELKLFPR